MTSVWTNRGAGEDWSCEPLRELELEETMNASQPAAAAASVGLGGAAATGFWLQQDATRHHPGGRPRSGRATAAETRVGRWENAGAGPTRLHLWCARSRDRRGVACCTRAVRPALVVWASVRAVAARIGASMYDGRRRRLRYTGRTRRRFTGSS